MCRGWGGAGGEGSGGRTKSQIDEVGRYWFFRGPQRRGDRLRADGLGGQILAFAADPTITLGGSRLVVRFFPALRPRPTG